MPHHDYMLCSWIGSTSWLHQQRSPLHRCCPGSQVRLVWRVPRSKDDIDAKLLTAYISSCSRWRELQQLRSQYNASINYVHISAMANCMAHIMAASAPAAQEALRQDPHYTSFVQRLLKVGSKRLHDFNFILLHSSVTHCACNCYYLSEEKTLRIKSSFARDYH